MRHRPGDGPSSVPSSCEPGVRTLLSEPRLPPPMKADNRLLQGGCSGLT